MNALNLPRYSDNEVFKYLKDVTDVASLSPKERARYERDLKDLRDAYSLDMTYEHGLKKAKDEGKTEGRTEEKLSIAQKLIRLKISPKVISSATGLSIDEINAIDLN
jgi:predicted transposase/invertase (TIGR01784 family)